MSENPVAKSAFGPIVLSAIEHQEPPDRRLVDDDLAASFLPKPLQAVVRATRFDPVRRAVVAASERSGPGLWANLSCRKSYIDDNLAESLPDVDAVVILGAGLDTRPYRLARHSDVPVFEVDLPVNIARKRAVVARVFGAAPTSVRLVSVDFERDDLMATLASYGYRLEFRTFFVWEGVTQYLTGEAVAATFGQLARAASGSRLDFTYVRRDFIDGVNLYGAPAVYRKFRQRSRVWKFGLAPEDVDAFLANYGWRLLDQAGPDELMDRYVRPARRDLTASQIEWSAYAEKV
ncbi:MAG TPA: SAM-dependent methyltransferase [Mycobacterium sp.]|nr:SAM-dependent methyltransferase [Mycobacterium sp.]